MDTPDDLRVSRLRLGDDELLVVSHPVDARPLEATPLTAAEADVAALAIRGLTNAEIADARGTAVRTVANQMAHVLRKLELSSRQELAARFTRGRLVDG